MSIDNSGFTYKKGENVLMQASNVSWGKSNTKSLIGTLYLTTQRLVFVENKPRGFVSFLKDLISSTASTATYHAIDLSQIATIRRGSLALHKNVLHVSTVDDIRYIYILNTDVQDWINAFQKAKL